MYICTSSLSYQLVQNFLIGPLFMVNFVLGYIVNMLYKSLEEVMKLKDDSC